MRSPIQWRTDSNGLVIGPAIHDGALTEILVRDDMVRIRATGIAGNEVEIELTDVELTGVGGNAPGAIFDSLLINRLGGIKHYDAGPWKLLLHGVTSEDKYEEHAANLIRTKPDQLLVQGLCSYGAQLAAVCGRVSIWNTSTANLTT